MASEATTALTSCNLFRKTSGECSSIRLNGTEANIDLDCDPSLDWDVYRYYKETDADNNTLCLLWKKPVTDMNNIILPGIVFAALCVLLFIMVCQSVREKAAMRAAYQANYKKIQTSATAEVSEPTRSRIPHSQFSCGGMTLTFQVSSNMGTPTPGNKPKVDPLLAAVEETTKTEKV